MYCPYCLADIKSKTMVCANERCALYDQSVPAKPPRLLSRLPDGVRIRGGRAFAEAETRCDACGSPCDAVCESCGAVIPGVWTRYPTKNILMLGMSGAGKSTLLATSKQRLSQRQRISLSPLQPGETAERFYAQYAQPIAQRREGVAHTPEEAPRPFLWGVTARSGGMSRTMALAVYDIPGEMLSSHAATAPVQALLARADAILLAVNPVTVPAVFEKCGSPQAITPAPDAWERAERILDELLCRRGLGGKSGIQAALVLTHMDIWFSAMTDIGSADGMSDAYLRAQMLRWRGGALLTRLSEFRHQRVFATGLYRGEELRPLDGADAPMLYLMNQMGIGLNSER